MNGEEIHKTELTELILGRKGGETTVKIIDQLLIRPYNINQIAHKLNIDYKTVSYHIEKIYEHHYLLKGDTEYGNLYYISPKLKKSLNEFKQIKKYLKNE